MTLNAGTATVEIRGDLAPLKRDMGTVDDIARRTGAQTGTQFASGLTSSKSKVASAAGTLKNVFYLAGGVALAQGLKTFTFDAAQEARKIGVQTEAVLKSTGNAANVTATEIADLAQSISDYSAIDDEAIQQGQNLLLTFKNIRNEAGRGNDIFNQSTRILTDMSVAMKTDVSSGAIQLGKALNDPLRGISALTRVGVTFSEEQKKVIARLVETGDIAGAQKIILEELKTEFGGSARAAGNVDPYGRLNRKLENLGETIGSKTLPALDSLAEGVISTLGGESAPQDSLNAFFDSFTANDRAVDDTSNLIAEFGKQLVAGVISVDEYKEKVRQQTEQTKALSQQYPDVISLQDELKFQYALSTAALRRYNDQIYANKINFQQADAAASDYLNTVGAAESVQMADNAAGGVPRGGGRGGRNPGVGGTPPRGATSVTNVIQVDARGANLTEAQIERAIQRGLEASRHRDARISTTRLAS